MSLWQGTRWTHRANPSAPAIHRPTPSGSSSAAASTSSLLSTGSGTSPRRPLNQFNLRQERSGSVPRSKPTDVPKSDHDPLKTLIGILGETPESQDQVLQLEKDGKAVSQQKADAGGKMLTEWLEELEKDKLEKLSTVVERRLYPKYERN